MMKHFKFFIFFLCIITLSLDVSSAQNIESSNLNKQSDKIIDIIVPITCTILGVIIGGLLTYFSTLKQVEKWAKISYISTLLGQQHFADHLSGLLQKIEMINTSDQDQTVQQDRINEINDEVRKTWFFLLFTPSQKRYNELTHQIKNEQWNDFVNTISKFLRGKW